MRNMFKKLSIWFFRKAFKLDNNRKEVKNGRRK